MGKIPVFKGGDVVFQVEVDADMLEELSKSTWYSCASPRHTSQYAQRKVKDMAGEFRNQKLHHAVLGLPLNHGLIVDHIDRNPLNCRKDNLRMVTSRENVWNKGKTPRKTTSKFIGVSISTHGRWVAVIDRQHIGYFDTEEAAAIAYDYEARKRRGEFAALNFPGICEKPQADRKTLTRRKYITTGKAKGKLRYLVQITCCVPRILNTRLTLEEAIEFRNEKLNELGVPIPD